MRYPADQNQKTRRRILTAAGKVFRQKGFHGAGIGAVMEEAAMTKGGFSQHFESKESLLAETLSEVLSQKEHKWFSGYEGLAGEAWLTEAISRYLSMAHCRNVQDGCPVPALLSEISRSGELPRQAFEERLLSIAQHLAEHLPAGGGAEQRGKALAILSMCAGALALARAVSDEALAEQIITEARAFLLEALKEPRRTEQKNERNASIGGRPSTGAVKRKPGTAKRPA